MIPYQIQHINTIDKAKPLQEISIQSFRESYAHKNDPVDFQNYMDQAFAISKLEEELQHPESFFYFLYIGEPNKAANQTLAGYLKLNIGAAQTDKRFLEALEVERIYLFQAFQRKGLGRVMIQYAIEQAKASNKPFVWLGVWTENPEAIAFYKRMGFELFGTHTFTIGTDEQVDELYRLFV